MAQDFGDDMGNALLNFVTKVGMLVSAQYGSNTAAGNAYGHVGIYIGDGKVMDSIYSGLRTISLSDWVSQNGRGWVVCGYPWDWR